MSPGTEATARSRRGRFPDPRMSWLIGATEARRYWRKLRGQDLWLIVAGFGLLVLVLMLPVVFLMVRDLGADLIAGDAPTDLVSLGFVAAWLAFLAFGLLSGVGSEGEADDQDGLLSVRPPKDVAGGLCVYIMLGYLPFAALPVAVATAGFAAGVGDAVAAVGILAAAAVMFVTATLVGYAIGLHLKGVIRRSPGLSRAKPLLGLAVVFGYFYLAFTGELWAALTWTADVLTATPLGWLGELALVTTPGGGASMSEAAAAVVAAVVVVPLSVLAAVHGGEYAWFAELPAVEDDGPGRTRDDHHRSTGERVVRALARAGVDAPTRGIAAVVLVRGYRAPLQLAYVLVPFLFLLPVFDQLVRLGEVPDWMPWLVVLYGAWAAGVGFPLNILGNQGATLPRLLTAPVGGRQLLAGYVLASAIVFVPITVALAVGAGVLADRPPVTLVLLAVSAVVAVVAGCVLAAGIGAMFPRFSSIELTGNTEAVLPSKTAFAVYSIIAVLATSSVGVLADSLYRDIMAMLITDVLPLDMTVSATALLVAGVFIAGAVALALPAAYAVGVSRLDAYRIS